MFGASYTSLAKTSALVTLGLGYIICYLASKTDKTLRTLGYIVGVVIIAVSAGILLCQLLLTARMCAIGTMKGQTPSTMYHPSME